MTTIGGAVKLTGEDTYRKAVRGIARDLREMSAEMRAVASAPDNSANRAQNAQRLEGIYARQKSSINALRGEYTALAAKAQEQTAKHNELNRVFDLETDKLKKIENEQGKTSKAYKAQQQVVNELSQKVKTSANATAANERELSRLRIQLSNAETQSNKTASSIEKLAQAEKKAENATKGMGHSVAKSGDDWSVMSGAMANLASTAVMAGVQGVQQLGQKVVDVGKQAVNSYADYEQLSGGIKKLFGNMGLSVDEYAQKTGQSVDAVQGEWQRLENSQNTILANADNAFATAGMSANQYMETATSFSASLIQGLGGDTEAAAALTDKAIQDMADNANTFGSDISSLQYAYQGFAKQSFAMLDNLRLGYGGSAAEMSRLINDSGVLGDTMTATADNVKDISFDKYIEAIHKVQEEQNITGTTAREAAGTIEGSKNMMLASWQNLLTGMAKENQDLEPLFGQLLDSAQAYMENVLPAVARTIGSMSQAVKMAVSEIVPKIGAMIEEHLPNLLGVAGELVSTLAQGILKTLPSLLKAVIQGVQQVMEVLGREAPNIAKTAGEVIPMIAREIVSGLPKLMATWWGVMANLWECIPDVIENIVNTIPQLIDELTDQIASGDNKMLGAALKMLGSIVVAIVRIIPAILQALPKIVVSMANFLATSVGKLAEGARQMLTGVIMAITQTVPKVVQEMPQIVTAAVGVLGQRVWQMYNAARDFFNEIPNAIGSAVGGVVSGLGDLVGSAVQAVRDGFQRMADAGGYLISGLWEGLLGKLNWVREQIANVGSNIVGFFENAFRIDSPSKVMRDRVGKFIALGIAQGIRQNRAAVNRAAKDLAKGLKKSVSAKDWNDAGSTIANTFTTALESNLKSQKSKLNRLWGNLYDAQLRQNNAAQKKYQNAISAREKAWNARIKAQTDKKRKAELQKAKENSLKGLKKQLEALKSARSTMQSQYKSLAKDAMSIYSDALSEVQTKISEKATNRIENLTSKAQAKMDEVREKIDGMKNRLKGYGELFTVEDDIVNLENIKQQTQNIKQFYKNITKLKGKVSAGLLAEITEMEVGEGLSFTDKLLNISSKQLKEYNKSYVEKMKISDKIANTLYASQVKQIKTEYADKVKGVLQKTAKDLQSVGKLAAKGFIKGMYEADWADDIKGLAMRYVAQFKKALKIKSPSRVFEEMGEMSGQGYRMGLQRDLAKVNKVMEITQNPQPNNDYLVDSFKKALSSMTVELDDREMGRFVDKTVTSLVYS